MLGSLLTTGDKVEVMRTAGLANSPVDKKVYYSQVVEIDQDDRITITMPIEAGRIIPLSLNERFWFVFFTQGGMYQAKGVILAREKQGNVHVVYIRLLTELERIQRRQFYRIDCVLDVEYRVMDPMEAKGFEILRTKAYKTMEERLKIKRFLVPMNDNWNPGVAIDISGGGMRINTKIYYEEKPEYVEMRFALRLGEYLKEIRSPARVIRYSKVKNIPDTYELRIEFVEIETKQREDIVQYVFNEDRIRRKMLQGKK